MLLQIQESLPGLVRFQLFLPREVPGERQLIMVLAPVERDQRVPVLVVRLLLARAGRMEIQALPGAQAEQGLMGVGQAAPALPVMPMGIPETLSAEVVLAAESSPLEMLQVAQVLQDR